MSGFFDSEQVRESLFELDDLQEKLFNHISHDKSGKYRN